MNEDIKSNDEAAIVFGAQAEAVLNNGAYQYAITAMKGDIFEKLVSTPLIDDNQDIIELVRTLQCVSRVQDKLEQIMRDGTFSKDNQDAIKKNQKRFN